MIPVYILSGLLGLILLLLFSNVTLKISFYDDFKVSVGFWFLNFKVYPEKPKKQKPKEVKKVTKEKPKSKLKQLIEKNGLKDTLSTIFNTVKIILNALNKIASHIRIRRLKLYVTAASGDPALTGVEYGALCAVVFPFIKFLQDFVKLNERGADVSVKSDFLADKPKFELRTVIKLRVIYILKFGISALIQLVKENIVKLNEEPKTNAVQNGGQEK